MTHLKTLATVLLVVTWMGLNGCRGQTARSQATAPSKSAGYTSGEGSNRARTSPVVHPKALLRKYSPHEAFLSSYHDPQYGVSFRYPRNYSLQEEGGDEEQIDARSPFLKQQEDLDQEQPGAKLLATVLVPEDAYPNTTFEHGSVQLVVNETATEEGCRQAIANALGGRSLRSLTVHGIPFGWSEQEADSEGIKLKKRVYGGYSGGTCHEFFLTVAAQAGEADGANRAADLGKIMNHLREIVESAHIAAAIGIENGDEKADRL